MLEKGLGRLHAPMFAQPHIQQIPILINISIGIAPLALNVDVRFIRVPDEIERLLLFDPNLLGKVSCKAFTPIAHRSVSEVETA